jgi:hypothetical protein
LGLEARGPEHYDYILNKHIIPALGGERLRDVDNDKVQVLVKKKIEAGYSVQTAVLVRNAISGSFQPRQAEACLFRGQPGVRRPNAGNEPQGSPCAQL